LFCSDGKGEGCRVAGNKPDMSRKKASERKIFSAFKTRGWDGGQKNEGESGKLSSPRASDWKIEVREAMARRARHLENSWNKEASGVVQPPQKQKPMHVEKYKHSPLI